MTEYIRDEDGKYPFSQRDIRRSQPNTSFPKPFRAAGYTVVHPVPKPPCNTLQRAVKGTPVYTSKDTWEQTWDVQKAFDTTEEEEEFLLIEAEREADRESKEAERALQDIDLKSIRSIREYIAAQPDAPEILKTHELNAKNKRKKIK